MTERATSLQVPICNQRSDDGSHKPFRILSLAGGGFKGLFAALILQRLEERYGYPLADKFDLIAGNSVGGLLAIAVAKQIPLTEIVSTFRTVGKSVFRRSLIGRLFLSMGVEYGLFGTRFSADRLNELVKSIVKEETKLSALNSAVLIPAFNLSKGKPQEFRSAGPRRDSVVSLTDVAMATTAAPAYFPIHSIQGDLFVDGAIHANTPDILAISEALSEHQVPLASVHMVSIGTTYSQKPVAYLKRKNVGGIGWLQKLHLLDRLMEAQTQGSIFLSDRFLGQRYLRINKYLEANAANRVSLARTDAQAIALLTDAAELAWHALLLNEARRFRLDRIVDGTN